MSIKLEIGSIENKIYMIRGQKVMIDRDLALLYEVETKQLKRQVKRNIERFPSDFAFELNDKEMKNWRHQFGTSNSIKMGLRYKPYVFTEQGVAMLSSVLNSKKAIQVNIEIIRAFVKLREFSINHKELWQKIIQMEKRYDRKFIEVFHTIKKLMEPPIKAKRQIGFRDSDD